MRKAKFFPGMEGAAFTGVAAATYSLLVHRDASPPALVAAVAGDTALGLMLARLVPGPGGLLLLPVVRRALVARGVPGLALEAGRMAASLALAKGALAVFAGHALVPAAVLGAGTYAMDTVLDKTKLGHVLKLRSRL